MLHMNLKRLWMGSYWVINGAAAVSLIAFIWLQCTDVSTSSDGISHASKKMRLHRQQPVLSFDNIYFAHIGKAGGE